MDNVFKTVSCLFDPEHAHYEQHRRSVLAAGGNVLGFQEWEDALSSGTVQTLHIVADNWNAPLCLKARRSKHASHIVICSTRWVDDSLLLGELKDATKYSVDPRNFFSGIAVTCSGLGAGDREAVCAGVESIGGVYTETLNTGTTHVVALTLSSAKCSIALDRDIEIVLPHWIDDCLKQRRRIPSAPYRLPDPQIVQTNFRPVTIAAPDHDYRFLSEESSTYADNVARGKLTPVFGGRSFYLGNDLDLSTHLSDTLQDVIERSDGQITTSLSAARVYIGKWREGEQYAEAERGEKTVATVAWVFWCVSHRRYSSPRDRLLHYPMPRAGLPEFDSVVITISGYTGHARQYLQRLASALGAKYTGNMTNANTHLVTATESGEKWEKAHDWHINTVNHLWLEECYRQWALLPCTKSDFTHWPRGTHMMALIDLPTSIEDGVGHDEFHEDDDDTDDTDDEAVAAPEVNATLHTDAEAADADTDEKDGEALEGDPTPDTEPGESLPAIEDIAAAVRAEKSALKAASQHDPLAVLNAKLDEVEADGDAAEEAEAADASMPGGEAATPEVVVRKSPVARRAATPDVSTPARNASTIHQDSRGSTARRSAQAAVLKLRENMADANAFQQEQRRKHPLPIDGVISAPAKRQKSHNSGATIILTGCPEYTLALKQGLDKFAVADEVLTNDASIATHLVTPKAARTKKFLSAIPHAPHIVNWAWFTDSVAAGAWQSEADYPADPPDAHNGAWAEGYDIAAVLKRAKKARKHGGLFGGKSFLANDAVCKKVGIDTLRAVIEANGGSVKHGGGGATAGNGRKKAKKEQYDYYLVENLDADEIPTAAKGKAVDREWLMTAAMCQQLPAE